MDGAKILARLTHPGTLLVIAGAAAAYGSSLLVKWLPQERQRNASLIIKAFGLIIAVIGAVILFTRSR